MSTYSHPQADYDSFLDDCTHISGNHPTCPGGKHPTLPGSLLEDKQVHPLEGRGHEEGSVNANAAEVEDKQWQTRRTCLEERTERERREKVTMTADQSLRLGVVEHDGSTDL